jgi:hypothetical protein
MYQSLCELAYEYAENIREDVEGEARTMVVQITKSKRTLVRNGENISKSDQGGL